MNRFSIIVQQSALINCKNVSLRLADQQAVALATQETSGRSLKVIQCIGSRTMMFKVLRLVEPLQPRTLPKHILVAIDSNSW